MNLVAHKMATPVKLCVICHRLEDACEGEGPHIFDCLTYRWAVVDADAEQPISFHVNETEAASALGRYSGF